MQTHLFLLQESRYAFLHLYDMPVAGTGLNFPCGSTVDNVVYGAHLGRVLHNLGGF